MRHSVMEHSLLADHLLNYFMSLWSFVWYSFFSHPFSRSRLDTCKVSENNDGRNERIHLALSDQRLDGEPHCIDEQMQRRWYTHWRYRLQREESVVSSFLSERMLRVSVAFAQFSFLEHCSFEKGHTL